MPRNRILNKRLNLRYKYKLVKNQVKFKRGRNKRTDKLLNNSSKDKTNKIIKVSGFLLLS